MPLTLFDLLITVCAGQANLGTIEVASWMARNESTMAPSLAGRRCLANSFVALLPVEVQQSVYALLVCAIRPTGGDTTISTFNKALSPSGFF